VDCRDALLLPRGPVRSGHRHAPKADRRGLRAGGSESPVQAHRLHYCGSRHRSRSPSGAAVLASDRPRKDSRRGGRTLKP
jgi:hypothetical protein